MLTQQTQRELAELRLEASSAGAALEVQHGDTIRRWNDLIQTSFHNAIERFRKQTTQTAGGSALCVGLAAMAADYVEWMQWALGELPSLALAVGADEASVKARVGPCALVYFAGRVLDDFLDRHHLYRGRRMTLLASIAEHRGAGSESDAITVLLALLLTMDGLEQLPAGANDIVRQVITSLRRLLTGILLDRSEPQEWDEAFYERLVELKNVDYWRVLYDAIEPERVSPIYPLQCRYYALAQKLNDLEDYARDEAQGRPNIVSIFRRMGFEGVVEQQTGAVLERVSGAMTKELLSLRQQASVLPQLERMVALAQLGDAQKAMERLGVLADADPAIVEIGASRGGLAWHATADEFVQRYGVDALEYTACPVCHRDGPVAIFRKQGFQYNRCGECTHIYVSPRLREKIVMQMAEEEGADSHDPFLETQKIYAEHICRLLRARNSGSRLLDVGHGSGYLMLTARAYGFQVYGLDTDEQSCAALRPVFGERVQRRHLPVERMPWGQFDHLVMSHVIEHLGSPASAMPAVEDALHEGGLLYIAVPDSDALQFKLFGRLWDAVHPITHPQFFNERSLRRLLEDVGLKVVERVSSPALGGPDAQRWMRLFRKLGGDEAGELALLARRIRPNGGAAANPGS